LRSLIQENKSFTKVVTLLFVLACIIINPLRAQLDNRIFSFYPQPFYFIQKAISDTTIYPPLSALNEVQEPDTFGWPSLEISPSLSGTDANYMTGTHWGMLHYNKDNEYLQDFLKLV
jgi:hypothetical protein